MGGWVKLHRQIQENRLWLSSKFTKGQAWVDLLLLAAHKEHVVLRGYISLTVGRGQVLTSQRELAARWRWNRESVSKFLLFLKTDMMADIRTSKEIESGYTLITICNYEKYQGSENGEEGLVPATEPATEPATDRPPTDHRTSTIKKDKKKYLVGDETPTLPFHGKGNGKESTTNPNVKILLDVFHAEYKARFNQAPTLGAAEGALAKRLLSGRKVEVIAAAIRAFIRDPLQFTEQRMAYSFKDFNMVVDRLIARTSERERSL